MQRRILLVLTTICSLYLGTLPIAQAGNGPQGGNVVELFTSHGCSSCPPADKLLGNMISKRPELVALEFHVDYWNELVHGSDGNWVDPFSKPAYTERQRVYNAGDLEGRRGVYTPQVIIDGTYAAVGSDKRRIDQWLDTKAAPEEVKIRFTTPESGKWSIQIDSPLGREASIWLAKYRLQAETPITAGENRHLKATNHNIVTSIEKIQSIKGNLTTLEIPVLQEASYGCAILIKAAGANRYLGAANCPR